MTVWIHLILEKELNFSLIDLSATKHPDQLILWYSFPYRNFRKYIVQCTRRNLIVHGNRYGMLSGRSNTFELSVAAPLPNKTIPKS
jgi:hypothetical protein